MNNKVSGFGSLMQQAGTGAKVKAVNLVKNDPALAAVLSKLVKPTVANTGSHSGSSVNNTAAGMNQFHKSSNNVATNIRDSQTVLQMLPDMELPIQILVSSIISPKDMMSTELTYSSTAEHIPSDVMASLIDSTKSYFEQDYKIIPMLSKILRDALFEKGSYPIAVIPENAIDDIINNTGHSDSNKITLESFSSSFDNSGRIKNIGLLGESTVGKDNSANKGSNRPHLSLENFTKVVTTIHDTDIKPNPAMTGLDKCNFNLAVTDNFDLLKLPEINNVLRERRVMEAVKSPSMEAFTNRLSDAGLTNTVYKAGRQGYTPVVNIKTDDQLNRKSIGNPLILHLPAESVLNVFVPGSPEKHIAHFVMVDQTGNPVTTSNQINLYSELAGQSNDMASSLLRQAKSNYGIGAETDMDVEQKIKYTTQLYSEIVEQDLLSRLKNGVYGEGVQIANNEQIYQIMLARSLAQKFTQLLFIPGEQMTYFAFKYNADGTGKSLLDDMKMINSLRVALLLGDVHSSLRNSIGLTDVSFKLDEDDPHPQKTIEETITEIARTRSNLLPLGMSDPTDISNWLGRSSFQVAFSGHPGVPDIGITTNQSNSNYVKPDSDLSTELRKQSIMGMSLNPSVVDATYDAEFATAITANNLLLAKNVQRYQDQFTPMLSDNLRKVMMHSQTIVDKLKKIITNNLDVIIEKMKGNAPDQNFDGNKNKLVDSILIDFITTFNVTLPSPNTATLVNQVDALKEYKTALDEAIDSWISSDWFTSETAGEVANQVGVVKEVIKAYYIRKWMAENGVMTELAKLTMVNEQGKPEMNFFEENLKHIDSLSLSLSTLMAGLKPIKERGDLVNAAIGGEEGGGESTDDSTSDSEDSSGGGDGLDDMSLDDIGSDDTTAEEAPAEEPAKEEEDKDKPKEEESAKKEEADKKEEPKEANLNGEVPK